MGVDMSLDFSEINYWAVIVAAVAHMALGFLWYSPVLFGNVWMKAINLKKEDMKGSAGPIVGSMILAIVIALVLGCLVQLTGSMDTTSGITLGVLIGIIIAATIGTNFLYENGKATLFYISVGYHFIGIVIMSLIIALWQ